MTVKFQVESWPDLVPDLSVLLPLHWKEVAINHDLVPLDVAWDKYMALHEAGSLHCVTARENGQLVGYHIAIVGGHLHYEGTLHGITDVYFIVPAKRVGRTGLRLFQAVEQEMKKVMRERGLKHMKLFTGTKVHLDQSRLFEHLGYRRTEYLYTKMIGD